jgi:hypothetical protein
VFLIRAWEADEGIFPESKWSLVGMFGGPNDALVQSSVTRYAYDSPICPIENCRVLETYKRECKNRRHESEQSRFGS